VAKTLQPPPAGRGGAAPVPADPKFAWPAERTVLGTPVKRLDGPDKVTGRARYTFDITRPGMLYGRIVRSPHPHARVVSVDLAAAQRAPGVKAALVWKDPADPNNRVMFQGDEVAAVAADTEEHAIDAARLIRVEYEVLPHVVDLVPVRKLKRPVTLKEIKADKRFEKFALTYMPRLSVMPVEPEWWDAILEMSEKR